MTYTENVDHSEIKKFSDLASRWWDKESEFKPLHDINPLRLGYIEKNSDGLSGKKIIDVGCGGGILSDSMSAKGAIVTGIDMGEAPLSVARLHQLESGQKVDYIQTTVEAMAEKHAGEFDVVTCMEMMEHVPDPSSVVTACAKLVKPGGDLYFSTINRTAKAFAFAIVGAEYLLKMLPKGTHEYAKFIKPSELASWSRDAELEVKDLIGMHYNPLLKTYKLAPGVDVNYLMHLKPLI
ncbi:bifunctional 2-polyprenyl-6-hydroxyphenol methylase/3-demethylubiquinol 3-O-methyltransferase UbiG [Aliikangiella sp. G2MR2-5]|uniref:bifunctional 2-polyprenyl-6-hydroxyphenol methylase/3-demethylubiquinol 3-O-methyltransferase UbiG n=1 Tax=Aliikangiella sp. G2MR2-5 TaxID=2788943 RepID=UPI0018A8B346|nr:bifunctional 2-polyprenyl-6-hydroxyphenol methylase/3-demethylubiquinol 3-O-methyltransferase UbiG [Aliikangiella sp. G2MR2-5]